MPSSPVFAVSVFARAHLASVDVDWSSLTVPVKTQNTRESAQYLAILDALRARQVLEGGSVMDFSLQQLVDCTDAQHVLEYISEKGLCSSLEYPSMDEKGICHDFCAGEALRPGTEWVDVAANDEGELERALEQAPVIVKVNTLPWIKYGGGVFRDDCDPTVRTEALLVGEGVAGDSAYWKLQNSWGTNWGENGFIRLKKGLGQAGQCGVALSPMYPQISSAAQAVAV